MRPQGCATPTRGGGQRSVGKVFWTSCPFAARRSRVERTRRAAGGHALVSVVHKSETARMRRTRGQGQSPLPPPCARRPLPCSPRMQQSDVVSWQKGLRTARSAGPSPRRRARTGTSSGGGASSASRGAAHGTNRWTDGVASATPDAQGKRAAVPQHDLAARQLPGSARCDADMDSAQSSMGGSTSSDTCDEDPGVTPTFGGARAPEPGFRLCSK